MTWSPTCGRELEVELRLGAGRSAQVRPPTAPERFLPGLLTECCLPVSRAIRTAVPSPSALQLQFINILLGRVAIKLLLNPQSVLQAVLLPIQPHRSAPGVACLGVLAENGVGLADATPPNQCMYYACMVALQIRDVPEEVRDILAERAMARGQSLQAFLLNLVEAEARRAQNASMLARFAGRTDGVRAEPGETAAELAADRPGRAAR